MEQLQQQNLELRGEVNHLNQHLQQQQQQALNQQELQARLLFFSLFLLYYDHYNKRHVHIAFEGFL